MARPSRALPSPSSFAARRPGLFLDGVYVGDAQTLYASFQAGELTADDMAAVLPAVWRSRPRRDPLGNADAWRQMVEHAGYFAWRSGDPGGRRARRPWRRQRLYRGATEDHRWGMSWTKNLAIAKEFARNRQPDGETGHVWIGTFGPSHLLAYFAGEQEYLVRADESDVRRWRT